MKVETDIIASIHRDSDRMSCDTLVMFFMSFNLDIFVFIGNVIMDLKSH